MSSASRFFRPFLALFTLLFLNSLACGLLPTPAEPGAATRTLHSRAPGAPVAAPSDASNTTTPQPVPEAADGQPLPPLPSQLSFSAQARLEIAAGPAQELGHGMTVQLPPDALEAGTPLVADLADVDAAWRAALEAVYTIDTPFLTLSAAGQAESSARALLRLPARSPDSRLLVVVDDRFLALLGRPPEDGSLQLSLRVGPADGAGLPQVGSLAADGTLRYAVVTPRAAAMTFDRSRSTRLAAQDPGRDPFDCGVVLPAGERPGEICRQDLGGTVQITLLANLGLDSDQADVLAEVITSAMERYVTLGFTAARLTAAAPLRVVVQNASGDPLYSYKTGVVYLPADAALAAVGGDTHDLLHELAHWIQDEEYVMALAAVSGSRTWWLETAAENMVMRHDEHYIPQNLLTYGAATTADSRLVLQQAPYQWPGNPGNFYVHAQLLRINICDDPIVCPLTSAGFADAINQGTYPLNDTAAQAKVSNNLAAYARFLLGVDSGRANSNATLPASVALGVSYGEHVLIAQTRKSELDFFTNGLAPQMITAETMQGGVVTIAAAIDQDGVYPLLVSSGVDGRNPGRPVMLSVSPGAPFWYRIDDDAPQYHDGAAALILGPIHMNLGLHEVRLVAMGQGGPQTLRAEIRPVDLSGAWLFAPGDMVSDNISCVAENPSDAMTITTDEEALLNLLVLGSVLGDFGPDPAGHGLTWDWNYERMPAEAAQFAESVLFYDGAVLPGPNDIQTQLLLELRSPSSRAPAWPPLLLGAVLFLPGAWVARRRKQPRLALATVGLALLLLTGCLGMGLDMNGTIGANVVFSELTYAGGDGVPEISTEGSTDATPVWTLSGTADYTMDFVVSSTLEENGVQSVVSSRCSGTATYRLTARVYKDMVLNLD